VSESGTGGDLGGRGTVTAPSGGGVVGGCLDRVAPTSGFARRLSATRRRIVLRGGATDNVCGKRASVAQVTVSLARRTMTGRCRWLQAGARFGPVTSCRKPTYVPARGTSAWHLTVKGPLARGTYLARTRAIDRTGNVERKRRLRGRFRNFATLRVR
jgi:hypothetical protein